MMKRIKATLVLLLKGSAIGIANIIPGVSGGTIAVVLGIYDRLIESIAYFFKNPARRKDYVFFLACIFFSAGVAIVLLSNVMDFLLTHYYHLTMFAFMGLVTGGIPAIWKTHGEMTFKTRRVLAFAAGMAVVLAPSMLAGGGAEGPETINAAAKSVSGGWEYAVLLAAGFLAGGGMIVPGVSGSFILVLMGQYSVIISAIKSFSVGPLIIVGAGAASGIFVFSKMIKHCLDKSPAATYYFILGLVTASLCEIFPGVPETAFSALSAGAIFLAGAGASFLLSKSGK